MLFDHILLCFGHPQPKLRFVWARLSMTPRSLRSFGHHRWWFITILDAEELNIRISNCREVGRPSTGIMKKVITKPKQRSHHLLLIDKEN